MGKKLTQNTNIERPIYLREDVWLFLTQEFEKISDADLQEYVVELGYEIKSADSRKTILEKIIEEPAAFLCAVGLLEHPKLMKNMVLGITVDKAADVEAEYVINEKAVKQLENQAEFIILDMLGGPKQNIAITKAGLAENLARNCTIDYIEDK